MRVYYAHCMTIYNRPQELRDMELLKKLFPEAEIINPNSPESEIGYQKEGMKYFFDIIKTCDLLAFRGASFNKIPAGVYKEIQSANEINIPIIELPCFTGREMNIDDTRNYLKENGFR